MDKRRMIAFVIAILMCLPLLAACGGSGKDSSSTATSSEPSAPGTSSSGSSGSTGSSGSVTPPPQMSPDIAAVPGQAPEDVNARFADEIVIITDGNGGSVINPFYPAITITAVFWTYNLIYDRLLYPVGVGEQGPNLATEWETDDFVTFTLKLRDDVYFHNGDKFTAKDVVFTALTGRDSPGTVSNNIWGKVVDAIAVDDYTVQIILDGINVDFWYLLARNDAVILNERAIAEDPEKGPWVGTGAYILREFVPLDHWIFERNDNYWGEPPITPKLTMLHIPEPNTRTIMLLNGEAQIVFQAPKEDLYLFRDDPDYVFFQHIINNTSPIVFNLSHPVLSDWNFRMAVASAVDREEIAIGVSADYVFPDYDYGALWGYMTEFQNKDLPLIPEDLEAAKRYLEASTYNGETLVITTALPENTKAAEIVQQQLNRIGINTELNRVEMTAINPMHQSNQLEILCTGAQFYLNGATIRNLVYPNAPSNRAQYNNPEVTDLLDRAAREFDYNARGELYKEVQRILAEDLPFFNLFWVSAISVGVKGIGGFNLPVDMYYDLRYIYWQLDD